ncbi:hypothetical protein TSOC_010736 [Tetrabaena socialis]|uniref:Uncharacterized protein n=1 Tax=Tetrabaena socialis TaxID=47790 RepID=A0A2J7ZSH7_9CHLO|nr:hypothetical protein TSOC_010736 [Tetrabaena socialis]|eukprot:PNH03226.1 hypothetical protein TSOC_010736 [Tetrabaena socialis]
MADATQGSMMFMFEDESSHGPRDSAASPAINQLIARMEVLGRETSPFARMVSCRVRELCCASGGSSPDVRGLASRLAPDFCVTVRSALPGAGSDCFRVLRHESLLVRGSGEFAGMELIVEPSLRQHFAIPQASPEYALALSHAPDVFVGGSCRLVPIVQLLCALMADSFQRQGLAVPPWRREQAMLSKWLPQPHRLRDTPVLPDAPAAVARLPPPSPYGTPGDEERVVMVDRLDSSSSGASSGESGEASMGCSPVSVLHAAGPQLRPHPHPVLLLPPGEAEASVDVGRAGPAKQPRTRGYCAVHGFRPPAAYSWAARGAGAEPVGELSPPAAPAARLSRGGDGAASPDGAGWLPSGGGRSGLLAARLQQASGDGGGCTGGSGLGRIETRPPAYQGEMRIRVVKLVGFALPPPPQQQRQQVQQQQRQQERSMLPWRHRAA